jgi:uncharacterized repeat protein (TIGR03847 family)
MTVARGRGPGAAGLDGGSLAEPATYDLGLVDSIVAEAEGRPGERTFKMTAKSARGKAIIWLEKEQLLQVGISLKQFAAARPRVSNPAPFISDATSSRGVEVEFKAGDMSLRHDTPSDVFTLSASNASEDDDQPAAGQPEGQRVEVQLSFVRADAEKLADDALEVVAAGRKPCPLCGGPLDPGGHFCVRRNGHRKQDT